MGRAKKPDAADAPVQEAPTAEQKRDELGRLLDGWGLPINALARAEALEAAGLPDPNDDPDAWEGADAPATVPLPAPATDENSAVDPVEVPIGALPVELTKTPADAGGEQGSQAND